MNKNQIKNFIVTGCSFTASRLEAYSNSIKGWRTPDDTHPNLETNRIIGKKVIDFLGLDG